MVLSGFKNYWLWNTRFPFGAAANRKTAVTYRRTNKDLLFSIAHGVSVFFSQNVLYFLLKKKKTSCFDQCRHLLFRQYKLLIYSFDYHTIVYYYYYDSFTVFYAIYYSYIHMDRCLYDLSRPIRRYSRLNRLDVYRQKTSRLNNYLEIIKGIHYSFCRGYTFKKQNRSVSRSFYKTGTCFRSPFLNL